MLRRSDRTLPFCVRSEDVSASGRLEKSQAELTGLWLRPVGVHRTHPVAIPEELDLSRIDQTLGGSVRSLPLEHPVSSFHVALGFFSLFPYLTRGGRHNCCVLLT